MELVETNDFLSIRRVQGMPPTHSVPGGPHPDRERDPVAFQLILRWAGSLHLGGAGLSWAWWHMLIPAELGAEAEGFPGV